jgi:type I restriction-modification system DNA methylase subunit
MNDFYRTPTRVIQSMMRLVGKEVTGCGVRIYDPTLGGTAMSWMSDSFMGDKEVRGTSLVLANPPFGSRWESGKAAQGGGI